MADVRAIYGPMTKEQEITVGLTDTRIKEVYIVEFGGLQDTYQKVLSANLGGKRIPPLFEAHPEMTQSQVVSIHPKQVSHTVWRVTVTYSSSPGQPTPFPDDPFLRPADVRVEDEVALEEMITDANGDPVQNSAGDPFDPPPQREASEMILHFAWNASFYNLNVAEAYRNAVNADELTIHTLVQDFVFPVGTAKLRGTIRAALKTENNTTFWRLQGTIRMRLPIPNEAAGAQWDAEVLDQGFRYLHLPKQGGEKLKHFEDHRGRQSQVPNLLDGEGHSTYPFPPTPFYLTFPRYKMLPFAALGIP